MNHRKPTERNTFEKKPFEKKPFEQKSVGQKSSGQNSKPNDRNRATAAATSSLTKQEKELLEDCLDELYEDYSTYRDSLKKDEEMNITYKMFISIVKKLGLRQPK